MVLVAQIVQLIFGVSEVLLLNHSEHLQLDAWDHKVVSSENY